MRRVVQAMAAFRTAYPQETAELDDSLGSATEYRALHERIATDDLPRFEREFKDYLNQNTIRDIASLSAQLNKQESTIRDRVDTINESLHGDRLQRRPVHTTGARPQPQRRDPEFRDDLRACTDNIVGQGDDEQYSEDRFLQVKASSTASRAARAPSTRTATGPAGSPTCASGSYSPHPSGGAIPTTASTRTTPTRPESLGGQKEKLAYTILAASLAYQFKLDWESHAARRPSASWSSTRRSAAARTTRHATPSSLFTRLGLQLLIVTPLQKIHVIEPHVSAVGFVDNLNGNYSRLQCLTVEEYRKRRQQQSTPHTDDSEG